MRETAHLKRSEGGLFLYNTMEFWVTVTTLLLKFGVYGGVYVYPRNVAYVGGIPVQGVYSKINEMVVKTCIISGSKRAAGKRQKVCFNIFWTSNICQRSIQASLDCHSTTVTRGI